MGKAQAPRRGQGRPSPHARLDFSDFDAALAVPPPATQAHRAVDCIGSTAASAQLRALVNDFADPLGVRVDHLSWPLTCAPWWCPTSTAKSCSDGRSKGAPAREVERTRIVLLAGEGVP